MKECTCNGSFRGAEDYRDHLPCEGSREVVAEREAIIKLLRSADGDMRYSVSQVFVFRQMADRIAGLEHLKTNKSK